MIARMCPIWGRSCWQTGHLDGAGPAGNSRIWKLFSWQKLRDAPRTDIPPAVTDLECKWVCVCLRKKHMLIFSTPLIFLPILGARPQFMALFFLGVNKTDFAPSRTWPRRDDQSCGWKLGSASRCSARYYCFSWFNDCTVKQMQLWCFIKIHLCTTGHYTSATSKDMHKTLYRNLCVCTAHCCFSSVFFFFSPILLFLLLGGFALVAVVMEECHISLWLSLWGLHSVSSNLSNCIFCLPSSPFFSLLF